MKGNISGKLDILRLVLQPYSIEILEALRADAKRFSELKQYVANERTLSLKLSKLLESDLIKVVPKKTEKKYVNTYKISEKGLHVLEKIEKL
ncbi:MAG: winged helix-turn-helix transcriptional regulator [Candidatus Micrarchaeota archaeon]|nr:winged helix-turn-helix transcriptional regulator [Candidatus Micrarchaeota archaeon]MDE1823933.1 winged helix-turn-helix transcriptional regulator [Candidatus Micrarchaeota archaeon]MDE1849804.1 winged helix-turn-helix transcriptional regulator [Candidatus Micrarchaeota archaeon]